MERIIPLRSNSFHLEWNSTDKGSKQSFDRTASLTRVSIPHKKNQLHLEKEK